MIGVQAQGCLGYGVSGRVRFTGRRALGLEGLLGGMG